MQLQPTNKSRDLQAPAQAGPLQNPEERGAIGIAFLVWLFGGGLGLAVLIFLLLKIF